jgi:hypothetical protein
VAEFQLAKMGAGSLHGFLPLSLCFLQFDNLNSIFGALDIKPHPPIDIDRFSYSEDHLRKQD